MFKKIIILCMLKIVYAAEDFDCQASNKLCEDKYGWGHVCNAGDTCEFSGWLIFTFVLFGPLTLCGLIKCVSLCFENYEENKKRKERSFENI